MAKDEKGELSGNDAMGCLLCAWSVFVTTPIWLILFFVVLNALGDDIPVWGWVLYWVYVPTRILGVISHAIGKLLLSK